MAVEPSVTLRFSRQSADKLTAGIDGCPINTGHPLPVLISAISQRAGRAYVPTLHNTKECVGETFSFSPHSLARAFSAAADVETAL